MITRVANTIPSTNRSIATVASILLIVSSCFFATSKDRTKGLRKQQIGEVTGHRRPEKPRCFDGAKGYKDQSPLPGSDNLFQSNRDECGKHVFRARGEKNVKKLAPVKAPEKKSYQADPNDAAQPVELTPSGAA